MEAMSYRPKRYGYELGYPFDKIIEETGLPGYIWPNLIQNPDINLSGFDYRLGSNSPSRHYFNVASCDTIRVHQNIIEALRVLSPMQVLGHGTLIQIPGDLTAFVSIAEAATLFMDNSSCKLLWVIIQVISIGLKYWEDRKSSKTALLCLWKKITPSAGYSRDHISQPSAWSDLEGYEYSSASTEMEMNFPRRLDRIKGEINNFRKSMENPSTQENLPPLDSSGEGMNKLSQSNEHVQARMDAIEQQKKEILGLAKISHEESKPLRPISSFQPQKRFERKPQRNPWQKRYRADDESPEDHSTWMEMTIVDNEYYLSVEQRENSDTVPIQLLLFWLQGLLGAPVEDQSISGFMDLENSEHSSSPETESPYTKAASSGCWRNKIVGGRILVPASPDFNLTGTNIQRINRIPNAADGLFLTAAALFSLFENSLERLANCQCTFKAAGGDYLQARSITGEWIFWHVFKEGHICGGREECNHNVRIALDAGEKGVELFAKSPCILGWTISNKKQPRATIWSSLSVSEKLKRNIMTKYTVGEVRTHAKLRVSPMISSEISGAITFSPKYYKLSNCISEDSRLAEQLAAAAVVLVYDESRNLHLALDGVDIIEVCCLQLLKRLGCCSPGTVIPKLSEASQRLEALHDSNFKTQLGTTSLVSGADVTRQVSKIILEAINVSKETLKEEKKLLYWPLEDIVRNQPSHAINVSKDLLHKSWHNLAFEEPPLILAVGELPREYVSNANAAFEFLQKPQNNSITYTLKGLDLSLTQKKKRSIPQTPQGGLIVSHRVVNRWMEQCVSVSHFKIIATEDEIRYGPQPQEVECTYRIGKVTSTENGSAVLFAKCNEETSSCNERPFNEEQCFHYIQ